MIKKVAAVVMAAGCFVAVSTIPASATDTSNGLIYSNTCTVSGHPGECYLKLKHLTVPATYTDVYYLDTSGYIFDCYGVGSVVNVTQTNLNYIRTHNLAVAVVYNRPAGYKDSVTCFQ